MHRRFPAGPGRLATLVATALTVAIAAPAAAAPPQEIDAAVDRGVAWLRTQQDPATGQIPGFGGDWSLSAFAAAGVDPAEVGDPSAQDFYLGLWTTAGPDPWTNWVAPSGAPDGRPATDYELALLAAHAGGLQASRLAPDQNLLAQLAGLYNGRPDTPDAPDTGPTEGTFGEPGLFNGTVFGLLALTRTPAPDALLARAVLAVRGNQHDDGGWTFQRVTGAASRARASDIDMTGAGLAALCDAGVPSSDPDVQEAVAFLKSKVDPASGGFTHMFGINGDSASWAVSGLNACGIDPQDEGWAPQGKGPVDFLLSLQEPDGSFQYMAGSGGGLYTSQSAVRALAGGGLGAEPLSVRPAPAAAAGTTVPQAIVIDAGEDVRFCRAYAPLGATVLELLQAAGCAEGLSSGGGEVIALNGVTADTPGRRWLARLDGGDPALAGPQAPGLGELVALEVGPDPSPDPDPVPEPETPPAVVPSGPPPAPDTPEPPAANEVAAELGTARLRGGRLTVRVTCPATAGCRVTVLARATLRGRGRQVGRAAAVFAGGESRTVRVRLSRALRRDLRAHPRRTVRLRAHTRAADGAVHTRRASVRQAE